MIRLRALSDVTLCHTCVHHCQVTLFEGGRVSGAETMGSLIDELEVRDVQSRLVTLCALRRSAAQLGLGC